MLHRNTAEKKARPRRRRFEVHNDFRAEGIITRIIAKSFFGKMRFGVHNESDFIIAFRRGGAQMSATAFSANDFQSRRKTKARRFASLKIKKENQVCLKTNRCVWKRLGGSQKWLGLVMHL